MASSPSRVYWDACAWIALIQKEKIRDASGRVEDREQMCRSVMDAAKKGKIEILTSTFALAEVCKHPDLRKDKKADQIAAYFEHDFILLVDVDLFVGERARDLMLSGYSGLKPPDAVHLATALVSPRVDEMHTFDGDLIELNGLIDNVAGDKLKICKPDIGGPTPPLLQRMQGGKLDEAPNPPG